MSDFPQKRRFPRIPSENPVLVKKIGENEAEGFAKTQTVGMGGCGFVNDEPLGVGSHLQILISVEGRVIETRGRIVYEMPKAPNHYEVGVEFTDIAPWDRVVIAELCEKAPSENPEGK